MSWLFWDVFQSLTLNTMQLLFLIAQLDNLRSSNAERRGGSPAK